MEQNPKMLTVITSYNRVCLLEEGAENTPGSSEAEMAITISTSIDFIMRMTSLVISSKYLKFDVTLFQLFHLYRQSTCTIMHIQLSY